MYPDLESPLTPLLLSQCDWSRPYVVRNDKNGFSRDRDKLCLAKGGEKYHITLSSHGVLRRHRI